jgi:hypothetical protein
MKATCRLRRVQVAAAVVAIVTLGAAVAPHGARAAKHQPLVRGWPDGTEAIAFENLDGIILFNGVVRGTDGRDSSGWFVLDTGAGYLALDAPLAERLGITRGASGTPIGVSDTPLPRMKLGGLTIDQISPVLTFDAEIVHRAADRPVLGLVGQSLLRDRAIFIDYQAESLALIPVAPREPGTSLTSVRSSGPISGLLSKRAVRIPFRLADDGKILIMARLTTRRGGIVTPWLTFALDTGASKCVLFEDSADSLTDRDRWGPTIEGLIAPTLVGKASTRMARALRMEVAPSPPGGESATAAAVDVAILSSPLALDLARVAGEPVHGLLGYSFLRHFRVLCDYPNRTLWLDPVVPFKDDRPFEHSHAGLQLERDGDRALVVAVARGSPGDESGIRSGDEVVAVDGRPARGTLVSRLVQLMEGPPGSSLTLTIRRHDTETTYHLRRRQLL